MELIGYLTALSEASHCFVYGWMGYPYLVERNARHWKGYSICV